MWLDLDLICWVVVSKREETLATRYYPWPMPRVWLPLEGNKICIWCGYSSTHKKEDSDLLRSGTIETLFIGWVYVGPLWVHVYRDGPTKGPREGHCAPPLPHPTKKKKKTISLKKFSILEDSYFRVYSWPPSNFWIGPTSPKETNHLILSLGPWPLHSLNTTQQKIHESPIS